ncbi:MAG: MarR family transcriptional regulator [Bacteroidetes bacterium]|nr:MarR family transcriptional regulator [Bacteroidota bacterium]
MTVATEFILSLAQLQAAFIKRLDNNMSLHGISFSEYQILHFLGSAAGESMRRIDLAESVGLSPSGVTRMLAPMEKIGLIEKESNPRDARVSLVKLSKAGRTIYRDASATLEMQAQSLVNSLTENQLAKTTKYIARLLG